MNIDLLKDYKFFMACIPIIFHIIYLTFSYSIDKLRGLHDFIISFFTLPPIIIGQVLLYFVLKLFNEQSNIPTYVLMTVAITYIFYYLKRIILFKPYDNIEFSVTTVTVKKS